MSEQTIQNELYSKPVTILDKYICLSLGSTTINELITSGDLKANRVSKNLGKKPDVLIINKDKECVVFIEFKKPSEFNSKQKIENAIKQEIDVANEIGAKIFVATDGNDFVWVNPMTNNRILNADGTEAKREIKPKDEEKELVSFIDSVLFSITESNDTIKKIEDIDPTDLAVKIAGILKKMTFATSKMSLYTFVEVFLFKYLSDIGILRNMNSFEHIYGLYNNETYTDADILRMYFDGPRQTMETLFPKGTDGTTIINGQVFHVSETTDVDGHYVSEDNTDIIFHNILDEFHKYEKEHNKFINISKDFKSKLFETFMKNSDDKTEMGQFFTPLKVVDEMVGMVTIIPEMEICDPACGVGKFLLEAVSQNQDVMDMYRIQRGKLIKGVNLHGFEKTMSGKDDITTILAKANALIYFSSLFRNNNDTESIVNISKSLLNDTFYSSKSPLGTLEKLVENKYDLILANPPYYRDGNITKLSKATGYFTENGQGIEGLFLEWIIKSLKYDGVANIVLPDGIFANFQNEKLKQYILNNCDIEGIISLPLNTFFNTSKKTYIMYLKKKPLNNIGKLQKHKVFCYICNSIGESLNSYRFDIEDNDLHDGVNKFNAWKNVNKEEEIDEPYKTWFENDKRMKTIDISKFDPKESWIIDNWWTDEEKIELGFKKDVSIASVDELKNMIDEIVNDMNTYKEDLECLK